MGLQLKKRPGSNSLTEVRHNGNELFFTVNWNCMFIYTQLAVKNNSKNLLKIKNNGTVLHEILSLQAAYSGSIITNQCNTQQITTGEKITL